LVSVLLLQSSVADGGDFEQQQQQQHDTNQPTGRTQLAAVFGSIQPTLYGELLSSVETLHQWRTAHVSEEVTRSSEQERTTKTKESAECVEPAEYGTAICFAFQPLPILRNKPTQGNAACCHDDGDGGSGSHCLQEIILHCDCV
jgi:hypothetical protein